MLARAGSLVEKGIRVKVSHSYFRDRLVHNSTHGRIVNSKGLSNLLHAVATCGIGLHDGRVAHGHRYEPGQRRREGAALQARYFRIR